MARRKSTQELLAEIATQLPDNSIGAITPAVLRGVLNDIVMAFQPAYGYLQQSSGVVLTLGTTPTQVPFNTPFTSDATQIGATGGVTANLAPVNAGATAFQFSGDIEASNGRFITFTLYKNDVPTTWRVTGNGAGAGNPIAVAFSAIDYADPAAVYSLWASAEVAGTSVTFSNAAFLASVEPVNSYV